jgi:hypothetical protein
LTEKKNNEDTIVLCGANSYEKKYYFNDQFSILPQRIKDELQILCVTFTEKCGGIFTLEYVSGGKLEMKTEAAESDVMYDEIGAGLEVKKLQENKKDLFESMELFYQVFAGGEM